MASQYGQDERIAEVKTKLGADKLFLTRFTGSEGMSHLFEFRVEGVSEDPALDFDKQLGKNVTVKLLTNGQGDRYFTGTCTEAQRLGHNDAGFTYMMVLRPSLWVLSRRFNSRVFHDKKAPDIILEVLKDYSGVVEAPDDKTQGNHPEMEYCVQHRESDLAFVLRLMEAAGISYHFKFGDDSQQLVLCDSESAYEAAPGGSRDYYDDGQFRIRDDEHFYNWVPERRYTTNKGTVTDYKLQQPGDDNLGEFEGNAGFSPKLEDYRHPFPQHLGKNTSPDYGKGYAETRALSERATDGRYLASGDCGSLAPGSKVKLAKHPTDNAEYLVVGCAHTLQIQDYRSGTSSGLGMPYHAEFELMKLARFVPPIVTPKPIVGGPQTGVVVGDNSEGSDNEIHTDEYGRIKVHMHWNRKPKGKAEGQTMWCRVAQVWAGAQAEWGAIFLPRVGMEVLVEFLDGDPDRPIVTGCVYHKENKQPYPLPGEPFIAGWKSRFENQSGYHELVFIDTDDDKEQIRVHTDKDLVTEVKRDETRTVERDRETEIMNNDTHDIGNELKVTAVTSITLTVGASKIEMKPAEITIQSPTITIKATALLKTESSAVADHSATGPMTIKGAIVTIN